MRRKTCTSAQALLLLVLAQCVPMSGAVAITPTAATARIKDDAVEFLRQADRLAGAARDRKSRKIEKAALQQQLKNTRLAYKRVEFMLEYYFPEHIKAYINGPPLRHLDPYPFREMPLPDAYYSDPSYINLAPLDYEEPNAYIKPREVLEPQGLQALDEALFSEEANGDLEQLVPLTAELAKRSRIVAQALLKRKYIEDYQILEASRLEIVRIFTLGLTGFDTPGSLNAIEEARVAFSGLSNAIDLTIGQASPERRSEIRRLFLSAATLLKARKFDNFDRLDFLRRAANPLYKALEEVHRELKLKRSRDLTYETQAWNVDSQNLFATDFLNPYAYTLLKERDDGAALRALGKKIFYDSRLSESRAMSCAFCHRPELAFTDALPKTADGRNTPSLINAVLADRFFYDLRALSIEEQITKVVENPGEMATTLEAVAEKINGFSDYRERRTQKPMDRYQIVSALASYVVSLRSFESPFDRYVRGESTQIDKAAIDGFNLFMGKAACGTCHYAPTFSGLAPPLYRESESEVLGVLERPDAPRPDSDLGRSRNHQFQEDADIYDRSFKTVTVRNVELTAPYFHNGAYGTLDEVIDFYDKGGAQGLGLSTELPNQTLSPRPLHLTANEKRALKAFLRSLTDVARP
jgi:cytochrome c peroxidase